MAWLQSSSSSSSGVSMCREGERGRRRVGQTGTAARSRTHAAAAHNTEHTRCVVLARRPGSHDATTASSIGAAGLLLQYPMRGSARRAAADGCHIHIDATGS